VIRLFLFTSLLAFAQPPSFEVAAIKPPNPDSRLLRVAFQPGGRLQADNASLRILIEDAYQILPFQLTGGPKWLDSQKFSINATANETATPDQMRAMLRTLLAERFQLVLRSETKEMSTYALSVKDADRVKAQLVRSAEGGRPGFTSSTSGRGATSNHIAFRSYTMAAYAGVLSRQLQRMVTDETGLAGEFDFAFDATHDESEPNPFIVPYAPSLGDLGLKIDSRRGPVTTYVVDRAEMPSEN
jgi:uncharacterized protein (TIGR03435 family)